jgi:hypothetical protein
MEDSEKKKDMPVSAPTATADVGEVTVDIGERFDRIDKSIVWAKRGICATLATSVIAILLQYFNLI